MTDTKNTDAERQAAIEDLDKLAKCPAIWQEDITNGCRKWFDRHYETIRAALAQSQPPDDIAGWKSGKLFEDILRRRLGTASANDQTVETQHIIYGTELCALASMLDQLSATKDEAMATIDRMNAEKAKPPEQGQVETLILQCLEKRIDVQIYDMHGRMPEGKKVCCELTTADEDWTEAYGETPAEAISAAYSELARGKGGG